MNKSNERLHKPEEFNSVYAATLCEQANDCLTRWRERRNIQHETWQQARRQYADNLRWCHKDGLGGALEPMDWFDEDIVRIYFRKAAPTKGRSRQCRIKLYSNPETVIDIDPEIGDLIHEEARTHYRGYHHMKGDRPSHSKWLVMDVKGNDYGRLLNDEDGETAVDVSTLREPSLVWAI